MFGRMIGTMLVLLVGLVTIAKCEGTSEELRYRVTIEVETPAGLRIGSSVWSTQTSPSLLSFMPGGSPYGVHHRGEAVAVDLPNGRTLFGLVSMRGEGGGAATGLTSRMPQSVYANHGLTQGYMREAGHDPVKLINYIARLPRRRLNVNCDRRGSRECPYLVTFADNALPETAQDVLPGDLAAVFGPGYRLRAITLELVNDRPEFRLTERLPWLNPSHGGNLLQVSRRGQAVTTAMTLRYWDFVRP